MPNSTSTPSFIDLFAGAGGLSYGLDQAGFKCKLGLEQDLWAAQTFRENHQTAKLVQDDIVSIKNQSIKNLNLSNVPLIVGGPPCQGFSHSNTGNKDKRDPRNSLFVDFLRFVAVIKPRIALIENVPGLLGTKLESGEPVIDVIVSEFLKIGYVAHYAILDASHFGVPQKRPRLFILAHGIDDQLNGPAFPTATHSPISGIQSDLPGINDELPPAVTLWDAISDLPQIYADNTDTPITYTSAAMNDYQRSMRKGASLEITHHEPMRHTKRVKERFEHIRFGESEENVPDHLKPRLRGDPTTASGKSYSQNSRRQHPDSPCSTIVASAHTNFIHPYLHRNFTVRETMRIQSFPDTFQLKGKRAVLSKSLSIKKGYLDDIYLDQRAQIGNAVPPLLAKAIGVHLLSVAGHLLK
ncbi:DNA cytosine methyltransferase [Akkermansiaceae bacterium]|nr:DNA cytosine methyltransferase [Akkermansiaceae bacterium]